MSRRSSKPNEGNRNDLDDADDVYLDADRNVVHVNRDRTSFAERRKSSAIVPNLLNQRNSLARSIKSLHTGHEQAINDLPQSDSEINKIQTVTSGSKENVEDVKKKEKRKTRRFFKYFNLLICLTSFSTMVYGLVIYSQSDLPYEESLFTALDRYTVNLIVLVSLGYMLVSFCAAWGSYVDSLVLITLYFVLLSILAVLKVIGLIVYVSYYDDYVEDAENSLLSFAGSQAPFTVVGIDPTGMNTTATFGVTSFGNSTGNYGISWVVIQNVFHCCGMKGASDWEEAGVVDPPFPCHLNKRIEGCQGPVTSYFNRLAAIAIAILTAEILSMAVCLYILYKPIQSFGGQNSSINTSYSFSQYPGASYIDTSESEL